VTAAGQAKVVAAYLHPLEVLRCGQHPAQQLVIVGLHAGALSQRQARVGDPLGQVVTQLLELAEVEDPRLGRDRVNPVTDFDPPEALGEEAGELMLEVADLTPQLDASEALVDLDV
jgi:hypothetical protein